MAHSEKSPVLRVDPLEMQLQAFRDGMPTTPEIAEVEALRADKERLVTHMRDMRAIADTDGSLFAGQVFRWADQVLSFAAREEPSDDQ